MVPSPKEPHRVWWKRLGLDPVKVIEGGGGGRVIGRKFTKQVYIDQDPLS